MAAEEIERTRFKAPWGHELTMLSVIGALTVGVPIVINVVRGHVAISTLLIGILLIIVGTMVRGYEVTPTAILIHRPLRITRWPLDATSRATVRPSVMARSWRIWANGGLFSFSGRFSNGALGRYTAFVTDLKRTVVVETPKGIVVVSPDSPAAFVDTLERVTRPT